MPNAILKVIKTDGSVAGRVVHRDNMNRSDNIYIILFIIYFKLLIYKYMGPVVQKLIC